MRARASRIFCAPAYPPSTMHFCSSDDNYTRSSTHTRLDLREQTTPLVTHEVVSRAGSGKSN